jgi:uncharacterized protein
MELTRGTQPRENSMTVNKSSIFVVSLTAATFFCGSHAQAGPSFNCNLARMPSEIQICQSPRLSELDNVLASGYNFLKATRGLPAADAVGIPHWRRVGQCGADRNCIAQRQIEEIEAFRAVGAPVSLPDWVINQRDENLPHSPDETSSRPKVDSANPPAVQTNPVSTSGYKALTDVKLRAHCQTNSCDWFMIEEARLVVESPTRSLFLLKLKNWSAEYPDGNHDAAGAYRFEGETAPYVVCSKEKPGFVARDENDGWGFMGVAPGGPSRSLPGDAESALALYWAACHGMNVQDVHAAAHLAEKLGYPGAGESLAATKISNPTDAILIH